MSTNVFEGQPDARQQDETTHKVSRFRPTYRALSDDEKALHDEIKTKAVELEALIKRTNPLIPHDTQEGFHKPTPTRDRYAALALTALEESIMWGVKSLTSNPTD